MVPDPALQDLINWSAGKSRGKAHVPTRLPAYVMGMGGEFRQRGRKESSVSWFDFDNQIGGGPVNVGFSVTKDSIRKINRDCQKGAAVRGKRIQFFRKKGKRTITYCGHGVSRWALMKGPGGWTYEVRSKWYGGTTKAEMIRMLRSLSPSPAPTYIPE